MPPGRASRVAFARESRPAAGIVGDCPLEHAPGVPQPGVRWLTLVVWR